MKSFKVLVLFLALGMFGYVYADSGAKSNGPACKMAAAADTCPKDGSTCCVEGAACCADKAACPVDGADCCKAGADCCAGGEACCASHAKGHVKAHGKATAKLEGGCCPICSKAKSA